MLPIPEPLQASSLSNSVNDGCVCVQNEENEKPMTVAVQPNRQTRVRTQCWHTVQAPFDYTIQFVWLCNPVRSDDW